LADALGSTIALANGSGLVQTEYTYEPFGRTTATGSTSTSQQQYAGRENDGTGLYFYRARYYDPNSGRFVSEDPIGLLGGADFYTYAVNDPIDYRDPSGKLVPVPLATAAIGAVAGGLGDLAGQLAQNVRTGRPLTNVDLTEAGVAAAVGAAAGAAAPFVATGFVGAAALGGLANLGQTWITDRVEQKCSSRNKLLLSIALGVAGGLAGGPVSRSNGWDEASP